MTALYLYGLHSIRTILHSYSLRKTPDLNKFCVEQGKGVWKTRQNMVRPSRIVMFVWWCWIFSPRIVSNTLFFCSLLLVPHAVVEGFLVQHPTGMMVRGIRGCHRLHKTPTCSIGYNHNKRRILLAPQIRATADVAEGDNTKNKNKNKNKESTRKRPPKSRSSKTKSRKGKIATQKKVSKSSSKGTTTTTKKKKSRKKKKSTSQDPLYWREDTDLFQLETRPLAPPPPRQSGNDTAAAVTNKHHEDVTTSLLTDCQMIRFTVRGKPIPLRRHRTSRGFMYNPSAQAQEAFQEVVRNMTFSEYDDSTCHNGPLFSEEKYLEMNLIFRLRRPRKHFIGGKSGPGRLRPTAPQRLAPTRSDVDNLAKFVLDSLNELLYVDDRQIVSLRAIKVLDTEGDCLGATEVCIKMFTEDDAQELLCQ